MEIAYLLEEDRIKELTPFKETHIEKEILFNDIIYLGLNIDKLTNTAYLLTITDGEKQFNIASEDTAELLEIYQNISPYLLEKGYKEKEELLDNDLAVVATLIQD